MPNQPTRPEVLLVGAGPGDPGLLTLHAAHAIIEADVILHDALVSGAILAMARPDAELVPVGKRAGGPSVDQAFTNRQLVAHALRGRKVVRLKGGDPFIFGRGGEEAEFLRAHGITVRVIPGITAAAGIAAELCLPLTHRGVARSFRMVTARCRTAAETAAIDWAALADPATTLAVYMSRQSVPEVVAHLMAAGLSPATPAVATCNGTRPDGRSLFRALGDLPSAVEKLPDDAPTLVIIGAAVAYAPGWESRVETPTPPARDGCRFSSANAPEPWNPRAINKPVMRPCRLRGALPIDRRDVIPAGGGC